MMRALRMAIIWVGAAAMALAAGAALADRIVTTSGQTFTGKITEENEENIVIETMSGTVTIPRSTIESLDKTDGTGSGGQGPALIDPERADEAFDEAKEAVADKDWTKAARLLEGLLNLDRGAFSHEKRLVATVGLVNCYLEMRDAEDAVRALRRRAGLVASEADKKRLLAAADVLEDAKGFVIADKVVKRYDEVMAAAMKSKAQEALDLALKAAASATRLDKAYNLKRAAQTCLDKLEQADLYMPGFSAEHRTEVLARLRDNVLGGAERAVELCTDDRKEISRLWQSILDEAEKAKKAEEAARKAKTSKPIITLTTTHPAIRLYNQKASEYLAQRQTAEDTLGNLQPFANKYEVPELYKEQENEVQDLLAKLNDLKYHEKIQGMKEWSLISLWKVGSD